MDPLGNNPFGILTFIVAPAILTNASSVMVLGTSNRFARAIDRARALSSQVDGRENDDPEIAIHVRQLRLAEKRVLLLVRALTAFYVSVGSFAAASLISLLGAVLFVAQQELLRQIALGVVLCTGAGGVAGLAYASSLLVWETRTALGMVREETEFMLRRHHQNHYATPRGEPIEALANTRNP